MSNPVELDSASNIGKMVESGIKQRSVSLGSEKKTNPLAPKTPTTSNTKREPKGRTPSATSVRGAMSGGHITPEEAGNLNPDAGYKPDWNDVRGAFNSGHITVEEAEGLLGKKAKAPKAAQQGAQWVKSETVNSETKTSPSTSKQRAIEAPRKQLNMVEPKSKDHPNKGKQFRGSTGRLSGNRLSWDEMKTGKFAGAIMSGGEINKREGIKVGKRPSTLAQNDPNYKNKLLSDLNKEAGRHGE